MNVKSSSKLSCFLVTDTCAKNNLGYELQLRIEFHEFSTEDRAGFFL